MSYSSVCKQKEQHPCGCVKALYNQQRKLKI